MSNTEHRIYARIAGTGSFLPSKVVTNAELAQTVDTSDEWITTRTGIRQRHVAGEGETTSELGYQAALRALDAAGGMRPPLAEIAWSLVHMTCNRLLHASARAQELVIYDLLKRHHARRRALAARAAAAPAP